MKPFFLNFRTQDEMPFWKQLIWRVFGKKHTGQDVSDDGICEVVAYEYRNVTLIWKCGNYGRSW